MSSETDKIKQKIADDFGRLAEALTPFALYANGLMRRRDATAPVAMRGNQIICVGAFQEARRTLIELGFLMPLGAGDEEKPGVN